MASVLRCSRNSVTDALESLAAEGFLQYQTTQNRLTYDVYPLGDHQLSMIQNATNDRIGNRETPPASPQVDADDEETLTHELVVETIRRIGEYEDDHAEWLTDNLLLTCSESSVEFHDIKNVSNIPRLHQRRLKLEQLCGTID